MHELLIVRHAKAEARGAYALTHVPDAERALTARGARRMRKTARGLARLLPALGAIYSSPLLRAQQTARLLAERFPAAASVTLPALAPDGDRDELLAALAADAADGPVALIGHEPNLGEFVSWLLCGRPHSFVPLPIAAACLLHVQPPLRPGRAQLQWLLTCAQLRRL